MTAKKKTKKRTARQTPPAKQDTGYQRVDQDETRRVAQAGLAILAYEYGAVPNLVRADVPALEQMLHGLVSGQLLLVANVAPPDSK